MEETYLINNLFAKIEGFFSRPKLNIIKTIYFNIRTLPIREAFKFPIFIYGKVQFAKLLGNVVFNNCEVHTGMIKLGQCVDMFYPKGRSLIVMDSKSKWVFEGPTFFNTRFTVRIMSNACLTLGKDVRVGSNVRICCQQEIMIGSNTGIAYSCDIMDSNFHYILNKEDNTIHRHTSPVIIGSSNWIGNNSQIMKGTRTKDRTMVAARSLLNKDYISLYSADENITLAGIPAKLKSNNYQRIFSKVKQLALDEYFNNHRNEDIVDNSII